jgi:hypothetical protein
MMLSQELIATKRQTKIGRKGLVEGRIEEPTESRQYRQHSAAAATEASERF